jgi:hypothetical protein
LQVAHVLIMADAPAHRQIETRCNTALLSHSAGS